MATNERQTDAGTPRPDDRRRNVFELATGGSVPVDAVFLTDFAEPVPKDVNGRVEDLLRSFAQIPPNWSKYADLVLSRPEIFTKIYEGVFGGKRKRVRFQPGDFDRDSMVRTMKRPLGSALSLIPSPPFMVFIFPRFFSSLSVDGHCVSSQAVHLFIDPRGDWKKRLPATLCHEFFHLAYKNLHPGKHTGAETMIDEALGMHFAEDITGYRYFRKAELTEKRAQAWLRKKRRVLEKGAYDIFYARDMQPAGFYCGYALVRPLLESMRNRPDNWRTITAMPTMEVFGQAWRSFMNAK